MSAPRTSASGSAPAGGPVPRRVRPPRWLDLRLVLGVLLVLGSVLLGARVVTEADATVPVWAVAGDLAAGTVLAADDLVAVDVRLDRAAGAYLATSTRPAGRSLARAVRAGELLPRSVLEEPPTLVQLALPVQAGYVPPSLQRGQVVDVYAVDGPVQAGARTGEEVSLVVAAAPVQAVSGRTDGVLSTATTTVQVVVSVTADRAPAVLGAIAGRPLVVVVHESVDVDGGTSTAPPDPPRPAPGPSAAGPVSPGAGAGSAAPPGAVAPAGAPQAAVPPAVPPTEPPAGPPAAPSPLPGVAAVPAEPVPPAAPALPAP